jgi:hypothetical protein
MSFLTLDRRNKEIQTNIDLFFLDNKDYFNSKDLLLEEYNKAIELNIDLLALSVENINSKLNFPVNLHWGLSLNLETFRISKSSRSSRYKKELGYINIKKNIEKLIIDRNNYLIEKNLVIYNENNLSDIKYENINIIHIKNDNYMNDSHLSRTTAKEVVKRNYIELSYEYDEKNNKLNVTKIFTIRKFSNEKDQIKNEKKIKKILEEKIDEIENHLKNLKNSYEMIELLNGILLLLSVKDIGDYFKDELIVLIKERDDYLKNNNIKILT